jgi:hypothetical protein
MKVLMTALMATLFLAGCSPEKGFALCQDLGKIMFTDYKRVGVTGWIELTPDPAQASASGIKAVLVRDCVIVVSE